MMNAKHLQSILKNRPVKALVLVSTAFALCHCAQKTLVFQDACSGVDLYELGRQDGSLGKPAPETAAADELNECVPEIGSSKMQMYLAGRNAGLVDYCSKENGFNIGRSEQSYFYVCPEFMETEFLSGYHRGVKVRRLEEEKQQLRSDIAELGAMIDREPSDSVVTEPLKRKIEALKEQQISLDQRIKKDTSSL